MDNPESKPTHLYVTDNLADANAAFFRYVDSRDEFSNVVSKGDLWKAFSETHKVSFLVIPMYEDLFD